MGQAASVALPFLFPAALSATAATLPDILALPTAALNPALLGLLERANHPQTGAAQGETAVDPLPVVRDMLAALQQLAADPDVYAAAILGEFPRLSDALAGALDQHHPAVQALLEGQRAADQVWALHAEQRSTRNAEGLRRLLLAMVRDLRVVPILLARQVARMRGASNLPDTERMPLARLTRDIHAPLANRLGIWQLKWELEDLAFRQLEPDTYQRIARSLDEKRNARERYIEQVKRTLGRALAEHRIAAEVAGRPKHIYSIWRKMQKKNAPIGELYDLRAVRVLVDSVQNCYAALGVVHTVWAPIPSEFDDYIARPKSNDYRSLHTAVIGPEGKTLEVQIRTHDMHRQAELGVAAHWRYKEGRSAPATAAIDKKIEWMRRMLDSGGDARDADLQSELDSELIEDRVYALTPKGEVVDLPLGATPLDFAYRVHTMVGHRCRGAKVDGRIVPLEYALKTGERVQILTGKTAEPRRDWLIESNGYLASARSREKVRGWFHKLDRERNLAAGRELLEKELRRMGLLHADLSPALAKFNAASVDELQVQIALGDMGAHQVGRALLEAERTASQPPAPVALARPGPRSRVDAHSAFTVEGIGNLLVQIAKCCQPLPGEPIVGYVTRARGVSVHRGDCAALQRLAAKQPQRVLPVEWGQAGRGYEANVLLRALDRKWLLKDVTNVIAQEDAYVLDIHSDTRGRQVRLRLRLRVRDFGQLSRLLARLEGLAGVESAQRA